MVPLYSGVTARTRSARATRSRRARPRLRDVVGAVEVLVVERQLAEAVDEVEGDAVGRLVAQQLGQLAVHGVGAEAADEDGDAGLGHVCS